MRDVTKSGFKSKMSIFKKPLTSKKLSLYLSFIGCQKNVCMSHQVSYLDSQSEQKAVLQEINKQGGRVLTNVFSAQECEEIRRQATSLERLKEDDHNHSTSAPSKPFFSWCGSVIFLHSQSVHGSHANI